MLLHAPQPPPTFAEQMAAAKRRQQLADKQVCCCVEGAARNSSCLQITQLAEIQARGREATATDTQRPTISTAAIARLAAMTPRKSFGDLLRHVLRCRCVGTALLSYHFGNYFVMHSSDVAPSIPQHRQQQHHHAIPLDKSSSKKPKPRPKSFAEMIVTARKNTDPPTPPRVQTPITQFMARKPDDESSPVRPLAKPVRRAADEPKRLVQQTITGKPAPPAALAASKGDSKIRAPSLDEVTAAWRNSATVRAMIHGNKSAASKHGRLDDDIEGDDDEDDLDIRRAVSREISSIFGYNRQRSVITLSACIDDQPAMLRYADDDDDASDMEASYDQIQHEEKRR